MDIRMYEQKAVMEAGRERTFSPGAVYDVPSVLGEQWVKADVAAPVVPAAETAAPAPVVPVVKVATKKDRASA